MNVLEVEFRQAVKFPTGKSGAGRKYERMLIDHPESPNMDYSIVWSRVGGSYELVVTHLRSGASIGVPRENVGCTRPSLSALLAASGT